LWHFDAENVVVFVSQQRFAALYLKDANKNSDFECSIGKTIERRGDFTVIFLP